jgi:hypothetical protein
MVCKSFGRSFTGLLYVRVERHKQIQLQLSALMFLCIWNGVLLNIFQVLAPKHDFWNTA